MRGNKALRIIVAAIAVIFIFHQCYSSFYKPITTETARFYTVSDGLDITGVIIRTEHIVESNASGVHHFVVYDGERVAKNGLIAGIYDSQSASLTVSEIDTIKKRISDIEEIQRYNDFEATDIDLINSKVRASLDEFIENCSAGDFSYASQSGDALLSMINRRQVVTGETTDFSVQLNALNTRLAELNTALPNQIGSVTAAESGYFISSTDGYENVLKCEDLDKITPEFLNDLSPQEVSPSAIGKIVSDYEWYIAAKIDINDSLKYKKGDKLKITTSINESPELDVEVKQINISSEGTDAVVIFSCNKMNSALATLRTGPMRVISAEYSGLKSAKSALRVLDGKTGVYIVRGMQLKFIEVNVLYSNDSYIICEQKRTDEDVLRLYDEVVVKGKRLYDGKIVG
ncbi:MAG: hypothetical protein II802_01430 [Clostridia bacterium]|nr:hypothetical protein [Clostridia bacterium]